MTDLSVTCDFAIIDVKRGRTVLANHFRDRPRVGPCPPELRIPVKLTGYIEAQHSGNDGVSIEFSVDVTSIELGR